MAQRDDTTLDPDDVALTPPRATAALHGHAEAERALLEAYRGSRLPHAWVIGGAVGIGKATLAYRMARFVLAHPDPRARAVVASLTRTFGQPPVQLRTLGGTVPIAPFIEALGFPAIVVPIVNFDNNQHEENENLRLGALFDGIITLAAVLR